MLATEESYGCLFVMQRHKLCLAELRDAVRLSSPMRHAAAKGGKPAQS